ncbi:MAG: HEAT repeat domain-containing protein [Deltaproteobacteria bacterium]|nr:HEAT repeat domain-containing protein [Deltaproteobacteria bacterium]
MLRFASRLILPIIATLLGLLACGRTSTDVTPKAGAIRIEAARLTASGFGGDRGDARFKDLVRGLAAKLPALPDWAGEGSLHVDGNLEVEKGEGRIVLAVRLKAPGLGFPVRADVAASGPAGDDGARALLIEKGMADAGKAMTELARLLAAREAELTKALQSPEPDVQILALRLLVRVKARGAIEPVAALIGDPRAPVAEAAADALAGIGDERAVPLLIRSIRRGDLRSEVRAIEAMGRIGGTEAEAYLEMTAQGHEVPEVRAVSRGMLEKLRLAKSGKTL